MMENIIEQLTNKLNLTGLPEDGKYDEYFSEIADLLMNHCLIRKGDNEYEIVEIEFYLFTPEHQDVITYPRKIGAGMWYFHQSGVDLTFNSDSTRFGGILIKGICQIGKDSKTITGPVNCVNELWDEFNALNPKIGEYPAVAPKDQITEKSINAYPRKITIYKSKGQGEKERVSYWTEKAKKEDSSITVDFEEDKIIDLVFNSKYQFRAY